MKCFLLLVSFCLLLFQRVDAQRRRDEDRRALALYGEAGGAGFLYSANLDIRILKWNSGIGLRLGAESFNMDVVKQLGTKAQNYVSGTGQVTIFPIGINTIMDDRRLAFELGFGFVPVYGKLSIPSAEFQIDGYGHYTFAHAGFRLRPLHGGGFIARINYTPIIINGYLKNWAGLSAGIVF